MSGWKENWGQGPEENMYRRGKTPRQQVREQHIKDRDAIRRLLASLTPEHVTRPLISWANHVKWKIPRRWYPL